MKRTFAEQLAWDLYHAELGDPNPTGNWWDRMAPVIQRALDVRPGRRVYTVAEIDRMREALLKRRGYPRTVHLQQCHSLPNHHPVNMAYVEQAQIAAQREWQNLEDELRTYILAGIDPAELDADATGSGCTPAESTAPQDR